MATAFSIALLLLAAFYGTVMGRFALGFRRVRRALGPAALPGAAPDLPFVSVVVPARDEAASIAGCMQAILENDYPPERFELIVVDDRSSDATAAIVRQFQARYDPAPVGAAGDPGEAPTGRLHLLSTRSDPPRDRAHKKHALEKGIAHARGDLIMTTDADCRVPHRWIRTLAAHFDPETAFVSGAVLYRPGGRLFFHLQALEFLGLVALGAGAIGIGRPNLCNGASVAYRRDVFRALGGYSGIDHLTSGDDELLMQKIAYTTRWRVRSCVVPEAAVVTDPAPTLRAFFEQRRRWASKGTHYPRPLFVAMLGAIYGFYVLLLASLLAAPFVPALWGALTAALAVKVASEAALLRPACRHFSRRWLFRYFLPEQLLQIPYVVFIGAAGALGGYRWKGRRVER